MKYKGKANENLNYGVVEIDVQSLFDYAVTSPFDKTFLDDCDLTSEVINNMLDGKYTKVKQTGARKIWDYYAEQTSSETYIGFHRGDGSNIFEGLSLHTNDSGNTWYASTNEI